MFAGSTKSDTYYLKCCLFHSAEDKDGRRKGKASIKDQHLPNFNKKLSSSSSALLHKDINQGDSTISVANTPITGEQLGVAGPKGGRTKANVSGDGQEQECPSRFLSPRQHLALDPTVTLTQGPCGVKTKANGNAGGFAEEKSTLSGNIFSQSSLEIKNLEGSWITGRAATSFSLSDVSVLCSDIPDSHSTAIQQESEISHLIDNVTLTNENEPGSSISALIGQSEETSDQANLTVVSQPPSTTVTSSHPSLPTLEQKMPFRHDFSMGKSKSSFLCSSPAPIAFSSPETSKHSTHTDCETTCTPVSKAKPDDMLPGQSKTGAVENDLHGSYTSHCWLPKSPTNGKEWETLKNHSPSTSTDLALGEVIAETTLSLNSGESSLVEVDGDSENLSITTYEYRREDTSHSASPLKPEYGQDVVEHFQRRLRNGYRKETFPPSVSEILNNIQDVKNQSISCLAYPGAGFLHNCSNLDTKVNQTCGPLSSDEGMHAPAPRQPTHPPLPALKLPSPCKSKSLGDLTSEDIACNFESKYQCISKSFVTTGIRDKKGVTTKTKSLEPIDALTEQLRKLVSFDQEEGCQVLYSKPDASHFPRALVRKLSSRSQSRVRNIASRAKEKQEANKQKVVNPSHAGGVVLRNKPSAPLPAGNRHSTGSYIAGYLRSSKAGGLEGHGIPEGACAALRPGYGDPFCSDHSILQTEPNSEDKPEIYFLLRL